MKKASADIVGVLGASGALGTEIIAALDTAPYRPEQIVPLARPNTKLPFVRYGDEEVAIDSIADEVLERLDLLFLATPGEVAMEWGTAAIRAGVPVVDCSGAMHNEAIPMGIPWVNPEKLVSSTLAALSMPSPEAILASAVLGPLQRAGLGGEAEAVFFVPASRSGRDAITELSQQVVALFNNSTPPRKAFPDGLAFDLLPTAGEAPGGSTPSEQQVAAQVASMIDLPLQVTRVTVPVFSGLAMELRIEPSKRPVVELVRQILSDGGLTVDDERTRDLPRPRRVEGQPFAHAGRIRVDERGEVLRIWAALDNLRASATVAVGLGGLVLVDRSA